MKKNIVILLLLLLIVGCSNNIKENDIEKKDITYDLFTQFKKIDDETVRIYAIIENTSDYEGEIKYLTYIASDYNGNIIASDNKEVDYKIKPYEEKLIFVDLKVGNSVVENVGLSLFGREWLEIKKSEKETKEITELVKSISTFENETTHVKVKLLNNPNSKKLKLKINNLESVPMCIAYQDVIPNVLDYEFDCEYKFDEQDFVYELYTK